VEEEEEEEDSRQGVILQLKERKTDRGENCITMNFTACILHRILLG
jgi:hypothetical protein